MFTGIVQKIGLIENIKKKVDSIDFHIRTTMAYELSIGQSVSHNGICLTLIDLKKNIYIISKIERRIRRRNSTRCVSRVEI